MLFAKFVINSALHEPDTSKVRKSAPSTTEVDGVVGADAWRARPLLAHGLRFVLAVAPFIAGWLAIRATERFFFGSDIEGWPQVLFWLLQAIVVSVAVSSVLIRVLRRFIPIVALLQMSLVFPDHAPSRFKTALRNGSVKRLMADEALSSDTQVAAEQALDLVVQLAKHEPLTRGHTERVRAYADVIGQQMGLSDDDLNGLRWGALLHDVGKLRVPAEILNKPSAPTNEEWEILRGHPAAGAALLEPLSDWLGEWLLGAEQHHEKWDGTGYPNGLSGLDISLAGRIIAVADAYDVITSRRSYKAPFSPEEARQELVRSSGKHFDPAVVRSMLRAGLNRTGVAGRLGWLVETPGLARLLDASWRAVAVGTAGVLAVSAGVGGQPFGQAPPAEIAFADDVAATSLPPASQVTTTTPATTSPSTVQEPQRTTSTRAPQSTTGAPTTTTTTTTTSIAPTTTSAPTTTVPPTTTAAPTTTVPLTPCQQIAQGQATVFVTENLVGCDLSGKNLSGVNLNGANLSGANLRGTDFTNSTFQNADFSGADISFTEFHGGSLAGADLSNTNGEEAEFYGVNFAGTTLAGSDFQGGRFVDVNFNGDLRNVNFQGAAFENTNFDGADLRGADFSGRDLTGASFQNARVGTTNINNTDLDDTNFMGATGTPEGHQNAEFDRGTCPDGSSAESGPCW